ncbi:MAG: cellulase family glycosylhydrolase [Acidimicrobiales bacterium]
MRRGAGVVSFLVVMAVLVAACGSPSGGRAASPAAPRSFLGHSGRWLTDSSGQVVILHGLNMVYKQPPYTPAAAGFGGAAARTLQDNGFTIVRLGIIYSAVEPLPGVFDQRYISSIAATVDMLGRHGIYSLLDFHQDQMSVGFGGEGFPSWSVLTGGLPVRPYLFPSGYPSSAALNHAFDAFWQDAPGPGGVGLQQRYIAAWQQVAHRFANNPWVAGYDLFNEPWQAHSSTTQLDRFYSHLIAGIRSVDRRHLIFYEPWALFGLGQSTHLASLGSANLGMSFHDYAGAPATPIDNALAHASRTGNALILSEFGATDDYQVLQTVVSLADSHQLPWIEWAYCGCRDPTGTKPPGTEALVFDPAKPGIGANVNQTKLAVLAEPYPRVVSGTPVSYSFDHATHSFHLTYSTHAPAGHRFQEGSTTSVIVPKLQYPNGYRVSVRGAKVVSRPGSSLLVLAQGAGSTEVSLTITPKTPPGGFR